MKFRIPAFLLAGLVVGLALAVGWDRLFDGDPARGKTPDRITLRIEVVDEDSRPVPGAVVRVARQEEGQEGAPPAAAFAVHRCDASGRCEVRLPEVLHEVRAGAPDVGTSGRIRVTPDRARPELRAILIARARLRGVVLDERGAPVAGARVRAKDVLNFAAVPWPETPEPVFTDREGRYSMLVDGAGAYEVHAESGDRRTGVEQVVGAEDGDQEIPLHLAGALEIRGTFRSAEGTPVTAGRIRAWPLDQSKVRKPFHGHGSVVSTEVAPDGSFRLPAALPGDWIVVGDDESAGVAYREMVVDAREPLVAVDLVAVPRVTISGRVLDLSGRPLADVLVSAEAEELPGRLRLAGPDSGMIFISLSAQSRADGSFVLRVAPGVRHRVEVTPGVDPSRSHVVAAGVAPGTAGLELRWDPFAGLGDAPRTTLAGFLVRSGGEPVREFDVIVLVEEGRAAWRMLLRREFRDPEGKFRIEGLPAERRYALHLFGDRFTEHLLAALDLVLPPEGWDRRVEVQEPASVAVSIVPEGDGFPLYSRLDLVPEVSAGCGHVYPFLLIEEGSPLVFEGIAAGRHRLQVVRIGVTGPVVVVDLVPGERKEVTLVAPPCRRAPK